MPLNPAPFPIAHVPKPSSLAATGWYLQVFFLTLAISAVLFHDRTPAFQSFSIIFSSIVLEALPFMLLGTLISGVVEVFVEREQLVRFLPRHRRNAIVAAAFMGILFPVCECAIVPVVRKFLHKGLPLGSAVAFLLGGPIVNPLVFGSTLVAYSFSMGTALLRTGLGAAIAIVIGLLIDAVMPEDAALIPAADPDHGCDCCHAPPPALTLAGKFKAALFHGASDFYDIGRFLIMGAMIAALLRTLVPGQAFFAAGATPLFAIAAMMVLAVVLNLCSEADAFIAASFSSTGLPLTAQMAFMVLGPMLDIKLILMYLGVFTRRMIVTLALTICLVVFIAMTLLEICRCLLV